LDLEGTGIKLGQTNSPKVLGSPDVRRSLNMSGESSKLTLDEIVLDLEQHPHTHEEAPISPRSMMRKYMTLESFGALVNFDARELNFGQCLDLDDISPKSLWFTNNTQKHVQCCWGYNAG
jgi:hypothetical protein